MKHLICLILMLALLLSACTTVPQPETSATNPSEEATTPSEEATDPSEEVTEPSVEVTEPSVEVTEPSVEVTEPSVEVTEPSVEVTEPTEDPAHSEFYIPGVSVDDVVRYFNEVCLDAEFVISGNPNKLQKWRQPLRYIIHGTYTEKDLQVLEEFVSWLNQVKGFPGMHVVYDAPLANLNIHFCEFEEYIDLLGDNFYGTDGGVTFWYNGANEIYKGIIGYRVDTDQEVRNSVILEEIYNGLGPVNDTELRPDSVIYSGFSTPQSLTEIDELIIRLLYHPQMLYGMDAEECEAVIRQLYY